MVQTMEGSQLGSRKRLQNSAVKPSKVKLSEIVVNPVVNFYVFERHENTTDFLVFSNFAFVEIGVKVLEKLSEYCGRDIPFCKDRGCFVTIMEFNGGHVLERGSGCGGHGEAVIVRRFRGRVDDSVWIWIGDRSSGNT